LSKNIHGKYFPVVFLCTYQLPLHSALDCGNYHGLSNGNLERLAEPTRSRHAMSRRQTGLPIHGIRARRVESFTRSAHWVFGWPSAVPARLAVDCVPYSRHHHPRAPACRHVKSSCRSILHKLTRERGPCTINPIGGVVPSQVSPVEAVHPPATGFGPTRHLVRSPSSAQTG